jgi:drug/metabolite transporter (DMT)-like permease
MNVLKAISLKVMSALLFAVLSALVRFLGEKYPVGQIVFFRSAFAVLLMVLIYASRSELAAALRTVRPLGHIGRGFISIFAMFCNFAALARLPIVEATAISFVAPLITVALAALMLKERVRIYRWSAVVVGFIGILVMLAPYFEPALHAEGAASTLGLTFAISGAVCSAGSVIQTRRLTETEATSSIVFYFSLICAVAGLATWPLGLAGARLARARRSGDDRPMWRLGSHSPHRELSLGAGVGGGTVRLHLDGMGFPARLFFLQRDSEHVRLHRRGHHRWRWPVRNLARAPTRFAARTGG